MLLRFDYRPPISFQLMYITILYLSVLGIIKNATAAPNAQVSSRIYIDSTFGPEVHLSCTANNLPSGITELIYTWELKGVVLNMNTELEGADPSRYSVGNANELAIRNAVRDDGGIYTCRVLYRLSSGSQEIMNVSNTMIVTLQNYLPPLGYPECSISPDTGITIGSVITFTCDPGESNPAVKLRLTRPDGTYAFMTSGILQWTVREEDNMAPFMCEMTSDIFKMASRTCSATIRIGTTPAEPTTTVPISSTPESQITLADRTTQPLGTQPLQVYTTLEGSIDTTTSESKSEGGSDETQSDNSTGIIAGAVIGGLLIIIIVCVIVILIFRRKVEKQPQSTPPNTTGTSNPVGMRVDYSTTDNVYSKATIDDIGTVPSPSAEQTASGQARPMSVVYGVVDKTKSNNADGNSSSTNPNSQPMPKNNGDAIYASADNKPSTNLQPSATEPPVYGKVNKGREVDPDENGQDNRESSGMVDNIIYASSQH